MGGFRSPQPLGLEITMTYKVKRRGKNIVVEIILNHNEVYPHFDLPGRLQLEVFPHISAAVHTFLRKEKEDN